MRNFINIVEGDVVDFPGRKPPEPKVVDHGNGIVSKPLSLNDFVNDPPVKVEYIEARKPYLDAPARIRVGWRDYRAAEFPIFQISRIARMKVGETITLDDYNDNLYRGAMPEKTIRVTRKQTSFLVKRDHYFRDDDGAHTVRETASDYEMDAREFMVEAQKAFEMAKQGERPLKESFAVDWDGAWITPQGELVQLSPDQDSPVHHAHVLDDYFPELDDIFENECEGDSEVYRDVAINYALGHGWLRIRVWRPTQEFNVQMTVKPSRAALSALRTYLADRYFKTYFFDHEEGEGGGRGAGFRGESVEELMREIMRRYYGVAG